MCGIAGIFAYGSTAPAADRDELRTIRDHMASRGPDGAGEWYSQDGRVGLAHRRLSIIDLTESAAQPMTILDGRLSISFNGEIYNYRELRQTLLNKGYSLSSQSDTEVLLNLYLDRGAEMVHDLRGMFAFAIWDENRKELLLARDPYGIKPLYYANDGSTLRFASQVKALLAGGRLSRQQDPAGMVGFCLFGSVPEPYTSYAAVRALPAGSWLRVGANGAAQPVVYASIGQAWADAETAPAESGNLQSLTRKALLESVHDHMVADVPVGVFLSAGIDSGALLGLMREVTPETKIQAVTIAFEEFRDSASDETPLARQVARQYDAEHHVKIITEQEFRQDLPAILAAMDQPSIDGVNTWFVSKAASELGLKVAISGLGGDELFGGYPSFQDIPNWARRFGFAAGAPILGRWARQAGGILLRLGMKIHPKSVGMLEYGGTYPGAYLLRRGLFMPWELAGFLDPETVKEGLAVLDPLTHVRERLDGGPHNEFAKVAILESTLYMRNQLLRDTDWAGMAHSLEVRVPLVDYRLLRKMALLLINRTPLSGKGLLASAPDPTLPSEVANRAKTGFTTPVADWQYRLFSSQNERGPKTGSRATWARRWARTIWDENFGDKVLKTV